MCKINLKVSLKIVFLKNAMWSGKFQLRFINNNSVISYTVTDSVYTKQYFINSLLKTKSCLQYRVIIKINNQVLAWFHSWSTF